MSKDTIKYIPLEAEKCAANDENNSNDDCESQSIDINTTTQLLI
jgi:hypothetical protein